MPCLESLRKPKISVEESLWKVLEGMTTSSMSPWRWIFINISNDSASTFLTILCRINILNDSASTFLTILAQQERKWMAQSVLRDH